MALNYLLDPVFEMVNTAGKPATGGKINVFVHGTRNRYYCASDFNGTLLPFDIPLDSLGSAVILADDSQAYDVYVYNRYGSLMMSRYNVQPKSGGGVSVQNITSTDGTITVTDTAGGVDLSVNGAAPSVLRASGNTLTSDGSFICLQRQRSGNKVIVDQNGHVKIEPGWYHYDIVTHFDYSGTPTNQTAVVALRQGVLESRKEVDLSYPNEGTISLSAEIYNSSLELEEFDVSVFGIPDGMSVELVELGIHSIVGHGGGGGGATYTAGSGIEIVDDEISIDTDVVATKSDLESKQDTLTAGSNISIVDNVISATAAPQVNADWNATSGVSEILNKPDLSIYAESSALATVATTGSYDDLLDKPSIPSAQVNADWDATSGIQEILNKPALAAVATSGAYADLSGTPTLATVATSGSYDDLLDKPSIPPAQVNADWTSSSGASEILHKPSEKDLVAGSNITITESNDTVTISAETSEQVNSDWDATSGVAEILNKPDLSIYAESSDLATVATSGSYNDLLDKPSIPSAQINSDWDATSGVQEILNKPTLAAVATSGAYADLSGTPTLATVATSGDYADLLNKPSIPSAQVNSDWAATSGVQEILNKPNLSTVATTGQYADLLGKPDIPASTSELVNDSDFITLSDIPAQVNADWNSDSGVSEILNKPDLSIYAESSDLATVATSGSYNDLLDKPSIPSAQVNADWNSTSGVSEILNKPNLATVATTGDYSDLQNLPSIPAAQVNSDWNATSGVAKIFNKPSIPTATSDLTNDSNFITLSDVPAQVNADWDATSGVSEILHKPTIPSGAQLVPAATSADVNKVLTVNAQGTPAWANSSGGNEVYVTWDDTSAGRDAMWTQVQTALSQNKEVYIKDGFCVAELIGVYDGQVNFRGLADSSGVPPKITYNYYYIQQGFAYKQVQDQFVLPSPGSGSVGQVLGLVSSDDPPYREPAWVNSSGGGGSQVNSDWDAVSGVAEILNKPTPKTLTAGQGISIADGVSTITISSNVTAPVQDVTVNGTSVVNNGVAAITTPTVDQTYDASSTNAQSGVAVASGISDAIGDLPTNLTSAQIQALKEALGVDETVLYSGLQTVGDGGSATYNLSELPTNFQKLKVYCCASDNTFPTSQNGNCGVAYFEWDTTAYTPPNTFLPILMNGDTGTNFIQYWTSANVNGIRTTTWTVQGSLNSATTNAKWFHIYKIVGVHRIASN